MKNENDVKTYDFNSHAHVERDGLPYSENAGKHISTHTLTWSVTHENEIFLSSD